MELFGEEIEQEHAEEAPEAPEMPEEQEAPEPSDEPAEDEDSSREYSCSFKKNIEKSEKGGEAKILVTYEKTTNGDKESFSKEFTNEQEAECFFKCLSPEGGPNDQCSSGGQAQIEITPIELGGVPISAETNIADDLLVLADQVDELGQEKIADAIFTVAQKIRLRKK